MKLLSCVSVRAGLGTGLLAILMLYTACSSEQRKERNVARKVTDGSPFDSEAFAASLKAIIPPVDTTDSLYRKRGPRNATIALRSVYQSTGYQPLWLTDEGVAEDATQLLGELDSLRFDGIDPTRYGADKLRTQLEGFKKGGGTAEMAVAFDTACTRAYLQASRDLLLGLVAVRTADSLWFHSNDTTWGAPDMLVAVATGGKAYTPLATYRSGIPTYTLLRREYKHYVQLSQNESFRIMKGSFSGKNVPDSVAVAVIAQELPWLQPVAGDTLTTTAQHIRGFQQRFGLVPTGKADSGTVKQLAMMPDTVMRILAANMERLRWLPRTLEAQYVLVDIPLMEMFYRKDGSDAFHTRVVVGKPSRQTPALNAAMANVVFSPSWGVPPTILKKDVLPGVVKTGGSYLARKGLTAYDRHGRKVNPSAITAGNIRSYNFRQPPGARNALGDVKFNLPNKWDIYLHDTPHREDFPRRYRAKSSGCVRIDRPREFAEFLLSDIEGRSGFDQYAIDSIIETRKTRFEQLKTKVPVHIVYLTAFEDSTGSQIRLLPDIYKKDRKLMAALSASAQ